MAGVEDNPKYVETLFAIWNGAKTLTQIAEAVGKSKPAIMERLERLSKAGYISSDRKQAEGEHFSIKWKVNSEALLDFWVNTYTKPPNKINRKLAKENFEVWFSQVSALPPSITLLTIRSIGHYFVMNQNIAELGKNLFDMSLGDILGMNKVAYKRTAIKNLRHLLK